MISAILGVEPFGMVLMESNTCSDGVKDHLIGVKAMCYDLEKKVT